MRTATLMLSLLAIVVAEGQQCLPSDTPLQCWQRFVPALPAPPLGAAAAAATATQMNVAQANTGITSLVSPSTTALKDFLSVLTASIESSSLSGGNALTFDVNLPAPIAGDAHKVKLQVVFINPVLDPQIVSGLGSNAAAVSQLNDDLSAADNLTASLSYNIATTAVGRSVAPHRDFFDALLDGAFTAELDAATDARLQAERDNPALSDMTQPFSVQIPDVAQQSAAVAAFERSARATRDLLQGIEGVRKPFAALLSNQPQAYGSVLYHHRGDLVGPDEYAVKATLEASSRNLRTFYRLYTSCTPASFRNMRAADRSSAAVDCLAKLRTYAAPLQNSDAGRRISFSLDHRTTDARSFTLPSNAGVVSSLQSNSTTATLVIGLTPMSTPNATTGRIDFTASYENVTGDPLKDDRFVASATYTQKITDMLSIPISLIYANRSQYLSNVDEKLNAHFGLVYKLPTGN